MKDIINIYADEDLSFVSVCNRCNKNKEADEFAFDSRAKNGRRNICKSCVNKHRDESPEAINKKREITKKWMQENREKRNEYAKEYMRRRRVKLRAEKILNSVNVT